MYSALATPCELVEPHQPATCTSRLDDTPQAVIHRYRPLRQALLLRANMRQLNLQVPTKNAAGSFVVQSFQES